jgi:hypothetical protein
MPDDAPTQDWQQRALDAETRLTTLSDTLSQTQEALVSVKRSHEIDLALLSSDAVDLEAARLLTESTLSQMDTPDVQKAVATLRERKPFLFRQRPQPRAMSAGLKTNPTLDEVAEHARTTGDRKSLLDYLRAKRA